MRAARPLLSTAAALAAALPVAGAAAATPTVDRNPRLWATVNICDTEAHPNTVGLRASMPGSGKRGERMYLRFRLQFFKTSAQAWRDVGPSGDSGFLALGSARYVRRETGRNFVLAPPKAGATYRVRGVVRFEWRRGSKVVRSAVKATRARKGAVVGADPKGFSAAECTVTAP